ncbi:TetR family transcriptional regulator [Gordonia jinhuaensis]|uniref:TetR family transcriptional regulator n=1 Tax=Gordonia jinhuaensis TaxID=1517702 RepID=A0A916TH87_9ACTN|nr:TetR family transcriptional regulator [Gordonia jinhuaensis]
MAVSTGKQTHDNAVVVPTRPTRADAARNYDKLVDAAQELFATDGIDVALDKVAAQAGVGIGTLYRHFPNRTALVLGTFRSYSERLNAQAWERLERGTAIDALTGLFEDYMSTAATKRGMKEAILAAVGADAEVFEESRAAGRALMAAIIDAGAREGTIRSDVEPGDLSRLTGGLSMTCVPEDSATERARLIGIVLAGLRP